MTPLGPGGIQSLQAPLPVQLEVRQVYVQAPVARQLGLVDGQVVQALVSAQPDHLQLQLKGQIFQMPLLPYIKDGDMTQLRAQMLATGDWALQLLHTGSFAGADLPQTAHARPTRWQALLFQPGGFANWLELLSPSTLTRNLPAQALPELQSLWQQQRLFMSGLQANALKRWLMPQLRSVEGRLARSESVDVDEPRSLLRRLLQQLEGRDGTDGEVTSTARQALDEVESAQVKAAQAWLQGDIDLALVLPFADGPPVDLHIEREAARPGQPKNPLIINMHTDTPSLGEVWLKTTIQMQSQRHHIDLTMWAVRPEVAALAMRNAAALTDELEEAGLQPGSFQVFNAARPDTRHARANAEHGVLIDTQA